MVSESVITGFNKPLDIQDYIKLTIKKLEKLISSIDVYINRINNNNNNNNSSNNTNSINK